MAVDYMKMGTLNPVLYFINSQGNVSLPPTNEAAFALKDEMRRRGYELREADTLPKIRDLEKMIQESEQRQQEREFERDEAVFGARRKEIRSRMYQRMVSSSTSPYEREFIRHWLQMREEKQKEFEQRFLVDIAARNHFVQLEYDNPRQRMLEITDRVHNKK